MGAFTHCNLISFNQFLQLEDIDILKDVPEHCRTRSKEKSKNRYMSDIIITADTETSHTYINDDMPFIAPEVDYLRGRHIIVTDTVKRNIADYADFRKQAFGHGLYLGSKGFKPSELYDELIRLYGWDNSLIDEADQLIDIVDFLEKNDVEDPEPQEIGWVYQWAICLYRTNFKPVIVYGRKPSDMAAVFLHIAHILGLSDTHEAAVYFHNFSYDYAYIEKFIKDTLGFDGGEYDLLATAPHKILQMRTACGLVFRCSYQLSNSSLDFWSRKVLFTKHKKLTGAIEYGAVHYQNSKLYRDDWRYMIYDVLVPAECLEIILRQERDTLAKIPLTSTGYVRRDTFRSSCKDKTARTQFERSKMTVESYGVIHEATAGGYTHTNRFMRGEIIRGQMKHGDMTSFYPTAQRGCLGGFPISRFCLWDNKPTKKRQLKYLYDKEHCYIFRCYIKGAKLKPGIPFPTLSVHYAYTHRAGDNLHIVEDNGRILETKGDGFYYTFTELDIDTTRKLYTFEQLQILQVWRANKGDLPLWLTSVIDHYYKLKSDIKAKLKTDKHNEDLLAMYAKVKARLNSIFGCTCTDPVRTNFIETASGEWKADRPNIGEALDKFYNSRKSFMWYQWGCYTTALCRHEIIRTAADVIGWENCLYSDTDSIFYKWSPEVQKRIDADNARRRKHAEAIGAYIVNDEGVKVYYDDFADEVEDIREFRALHSKCYAYKLANGEMYCTIAGVNRKSRVKELGRLENLRNGFVFHKNGGTRIKYLHDEIMTEEVDGHIIEHAGAAIIKPVDKKINYTPWEWPEDEFYYMTNITDGGRLVR